MAKVLICGHCGAPLPRPEPGARYVGCRFCEATSDLQSDARPSPAAPAGVSSMHQRFAAEAQAFERELQERMDHKEPSLAGFRAAAERTLSALIDPEILTNVTFGIANAFFQINRADVTKDAVAMGRIALAYLDSLEALSTKSACTINLPFLTATASGPLHFTQDVTLDQLRQWAMTPAALPELAPLPAPEPAPEPKVDTPPERKSWFKKLLG